MAVYRANLATCQAHLLHQDIQIRRVINSPSAPTHFFFFSFYFSLCSISVSVRARIDGETRDAMAARGDDKNGYALKMTYSLLDWSAVVINMFCTSFRNFPLSLLSAAASGGCPSLGSSPSSPPLPNRLSRRPGEIPQILSEGCGEEGSGTRGHRSPVDVSVTDTGQGDTANAGGWEGRLTQASSSTSRAFPHWWLRTSQARTPRMS